MYYLCRCLLQSEKGVSDGPGKQEEAEAVASALHGQLHVWEVIFIGLEHFLGV